MPTLGCRFGENVKKKLAVSSRADAVECVAPALRPGFVVVGLAHVTGKSYNPGRDDISREAGHNVFEYVTPWRISNVNPEEFPDVGGVALFATGAHFRPDLLCNFRGGNSSGVSTTFVSSALVICEAQSSSSAGKSAAFMLQHDSHPTPDGQQAMLRRRGVPTVSRDGPRVVAIGGSVAISSSAVDETTPAMLSWQSRVGCSFGGVWVAATAGATALDVKCVVPATNVGELFVTTSDLNSRTPLPFFDDGVKHAGEPKHLGRRAVTVTESPVVSEFVPSAGTPIIRGTSMNVDVYGDHLHVDTTSAPLLHLCLTLSRTLDDVRLNCVVAINAGTSALEAANAFSVGFNAVNVRGGASDRANVEVQYMLQSPPQIVTATTTAASAGDVITAIGEHFVDAITPLWCFAGNSMRAADVVSSALARCVVPWGHHMPESTLHRAGASSALKFGVISSENLQSTSNLVSITWSPRPMHATGVVPNVGFSHGGAPVSVVLEKGGANVARQRASVSCRFGTIHPVSASVANAEAISCLSPALAPGSVSVGAPVPSLEYVVLDGAATLTTGSISTAPSDAAVAEFFLFSSGIDSRMAIGCAMPSLQDALVPARLSADGRTTCQLPAMMKPGFKTLDVAVAYFGSPKSFDGLVEFNPPLDVWSSVPAPNLDTHAATPSRGAARLHDGMELSITHPPPTVVVQRPMTGGETRPGDLVFIAAPAGGLDARAWCVLSVGTDEYKVAATFISSAIAVCETPTMGHHGVPSFDAVVSVCASHSRCASGTNASSVVVLGTEKTVTEVSPREGGTGGGVKVRLHHRGFSNHRASCKIGSIGPIAAASASKGDTTAELECATPARAPGVVAVAVGMGAGWAGESAFTFTFVDDGVEETTTAAPALVSRAAANEANALSSVFDCPDVAVGEIATVSPSSGASEGGTEMIVTADVSPSRQGSECGLLFAACRVGTIWPVIGYATPRGVVCVAPARAPGSVVDVSAPKMVTGAGRPFAFVDALAKNDTEPALNFSMSATEVAKASSSAFDCVDVAEGEVVAVSPSSSASSGGTEITLTASVAASRPSGSCGILFAACRFGTTWPVLGYQSSLGVVCASPARAPGSVDVSAPKLVTGGGRPLLYRGVDATTDEKTLAPKADELVDVHVKITPKNSDSGALVDATAATAMSRLVSCVFESPVRSAAPWLVAATAHVISSVVTRCEIPTTMPVTGVTVVEKSSLRAVDATAKHFSAYRESPSCEISRLSTTFGSTTGGSVTRVDARCLAGATLTSIDARVGCRYGTIGPITASMSDGDDGKIQCVSPGKVAGVVAFALTTNWRDASFEPASGVPAATFAYLNDETRTSDAEDETLALRQSQSQNALPLMSNVVPWLVWGGNQLVHVTGRDMPVGFDAVCLVGSSLVAAVPISSALTLCDPFPMSTLDRVSNAHVAGSMREVQLAVTSRDAHSIARAQNVSQMKLPLMIISAADVVGIDVFNGWEHGGSHVNVELGGWAPTGLIDCHFGTVAVHGREGGGAGWQSRAAMGRTGEWWSEATVATDVECVTPAHSSGRVPIGVSLAHSTSPTYGKVEYLYL